MKPTIEDCPRWLTRIVLIVFLPFAVIWTILDRTWSEIRSIPFYIRRDLSGEFREFLRVWRAAGSNRK